MFQCNKNIPFKWLVLGFLFGAFQVMAQEPVPQEQQQARVDFSENELKSFVKANERIMEIQQESQQKMLKVIEEEGLTLERFNEILESQQDPQKQTNASEQEMQSFNNAAEFIIVEGQKVEQQLITTIEEEGLDVGTYQEILLAYQQNAGIQERVNKMITDD